MNANEAHARPGTVFDGLFGMRFLICRFPRALPSQTGRTKPIGMWSSAEATTTWPSSAGWKTASQGAA